MIGSYLDKYEVIQKIGEGGMATVYRGRHTTLRRDVAIKVLHPHLSSSPRNRKRFAREARAIEHLRHDNILEIFDYSGVDSPDCFIVTEYVQGETLTELQGRVGSVPSEIVAQIGMALADALAYAHHQGILHRDLKPDNVMIRADGRVKLMDFGIARFLDESQVTMTGALVGSPAFMSPEQAREEDLDARSDLFSLGTLLYFLVSGHLPFAGANPSVVLRNIIEGNRVPVADLVPGMSAALSDVIERLMAIHREDRFNDATSVHDALKISLDEIVFPLAEPKWQLAAWLADPQGWTQALELFLREQLLEAGRARLGAGDALVGLRLINRLLTLDGENEEALRLVQDLHGVKESFSMRNRWPLAGAAVAVLVALVLLGSFMPRGSVTPLSPDADRQSATARLSPQPPSPSTALSSHSPPTVQPIPAEPGSEPSSQQVSASIPGQPADPDATSEGQGATTLPPSAGPGHQAAQGAHDAPRHPAGTTTPPTTGRAEVHDASVVPAGSPFSMSSPIPSPIPPPSQVPACIAFRSLEAPADVFVDGALFGTTRDMGCRNIPAGTYDFVLRGGPMVREKTVRITLQPGERRERERVKLELVPCQVRFPTNLPQGCTVSVDGQPKGNLGSLQYILSLDRPDAQHEVAVQCGSKRYAEQYRQLASREVWFQAEGLP